MRNIARIGIIVLIVASFAASPLTGAQAQGVGPATPAPLKIGTGTLVPNQYIVVLKPTSGPEAQATAIGTLQAAGGKLIFEYGSALKGFAATIPASALQDLRMNPQVAYIEANQVVSLSPDPLPDPAANAETVPSSTVSALVSQTPATWGLDRIDQHNLPLNNTYTYMNTGAGVNVYIIDTGILSTHVEFTGRASKDFDAVGDGQNGNDCAGHGTHVAGTIGSVTYGVAKAVMLHAVRVLDCAGQGSYAGVIAGVNWVAAHRITPAVANMSLGGGFSTALNSAVTAAIASGVTFAVAAGNDNADACNYSPASTPDAITVGSTNFDDSRSYFSNWGTCLDIFAPGSNITSTWIGSDTATNTISGTSMATPHVAGVAALYLQANPTATPANVATALINFSTKNLVTDPVGSFNRLLYSLVSAPLVIPAPVIPSGIIIDTTPTYAWTKVAGATLYQYYIYKGITLIYAKTIPASTCGVTVNCLNTPAPVLPIATYTWKVRALVGGIWSAFSPLQLFNLVRLGPAFNSTFTSNALGWVPVNGTWGRTTTGYYYTPGVSNFFASARNSNYYGPLTFQVRLKRVGSCTSCGNYIIIRGTPAPLAAFDKAWNKGIQFEYTNTGSFSIWRADNGAWTAIKTWTSSTTIIKNDWNILKISASAGNMKFYINGTLVWIGAVNAAPVGQIGFGTFNTNPVANYLYVDYASINPVATASTGDPTQFTQTEEATGVGSPATAP